MPRFHVLRQQQLLEPGQQPQQLWELRPRVRDGGLLALHGQQPVQGRCTCTIVGGGECPSPDHRQDCTSSLFCACDGRDDDSAQAQGGQCGISACYYP